MKRLYAIILSATFALALHSCGDEAVSPNYQEYPGDLAALGFRGPVKWIYFRIIKMKPLTSDLESNRENGTLYFAFDIDGNLTKLQSEYSRYKGDFVYYDLIDRRSEFYDFPERDQMGRVTLKNILNDSYKTVATISYIYDDDKRKCQIEYKELTQEGDKNKNTVRLNKYGYYGDMFSFDFNNLDMFKRFLKYLPERPEDAEFSTGWREFEEKGYNYMIKLSCYYYFH